VVEDAQLVGVDIESLVTRHNRISKGMLTRAGIL